MKELTIPKKLQPIVSAFYAESEEVAKTLIIQASKAIYSEDDDPYSCIARRQVTNEDIETVCALLKSFKPQDMLEALFAAQTVVSHMLGMIKLSKTSHSDQELGLKLLRFSSESLCKLQKKRSGGMQNVTVNYNYNGKDSAQPTVIIPTKEIEYAD